MSPSTFSVLEQFDSDNLPAFTENYIEITKQYRAYCEENGVTPKEYEIFETLYKDYIKKS